MKKKTWNFKSIIYKRKFKINKNFMKNKSQNPKNILMKNSKKIITS